MTHHLFEKLAPIIDQSKLKSLWHLYLTESDSGKKEIEQLLSLLAEKTFGTFYETRDILLSPPTEQDSQGSLLLGNIYYGKRRFYQFGLREEELTSHVGIFGRSGAGKTSLVRIFLWNFARYKIPFFLFDWKHEYRSMKSIIKDLHILQAGGSTSPFSFNPLIPPTFFSADDYRNYLKDIASLLVFSYYPTLSLFSLEGMKHLFVETMDRLCRQLGTYQGSGRYPTFHEAFASLKKPAKVSAYAYTALQSCLKAISFGASHNIFNAKESTPMQELLSSQVILELQGCGSEADTRFLTNTLLYWLYRYRLSEQQKTTKLRHVLICEEAHHHQGELLERIFRMVRAYGQSLVFIDQHPSLLSVPIFGNMYTTISLNLKHPNDKELIGKTFGLEGEEKEYVMRLRPGQAIVRLQGRYDRPFLIHFPHIHLPKNELPETNVPEEKKSTPLDSDELRFLQHVWEHPEFPTVKRYQALSLGPRKGNQLQKRLLHREFIEKDRQITSKGRVHLMKLTTQGKEILEKQGISIENRSKRHGGGRHKWAVGHILKRLRGKGYRAESEFPIGGGKTVDVMLFLEDGKKVAIEVETGESDIPANIKKCQEAGYPVIIVALDEATKVSVEKWIEEQGMDGTAVKVVRL